MDAVFRVLLMISTQLVLSICVLNIQEPNIPKVNGTSNEYYWFQPNRVEKGTQEFILVCDGPVLMTWKLSGIMNSIPIVDVAYHSGMYRATYRTWEPGSHSTGFFTCEAHEEKHRQSNPSVSIYIYVDSDSRGLIGHLIHLSTALEDFLDEYIQVEDTTELKKSKCVKLLIPCRISNPETEVTLQGKTYDDQILLFPDATYDGKRGFSLKYCNNTIREFVCRSKELAVAYGWRPLPHAQLNKNEDGTDDRIQRDWVYFDNVPLNLTCAGDSTIMFHGINVNSSEVLVKENFPLEERFTHTATLQIRPSENPYDEVTCVDSLTSHDFVIVSSGSALSDDDWTYNYECKFYTCSKWFEERSNGKITNWGCFNEVDCEVKSERARKILAITSWGVQFPFKMESGTKDGRSALFDPYPSGIIYCRSPFGGHINKYFTGINGIVYFFQRDYIPEKAIISLSFNRSRFYIGLDTQISVDVKYSTYLLAPSATLYVEDGAGIKEHEIISLSQGFKTLPPNTGDPEEFNLTHTVNLFSLSFRPQRGMTELILSVQMLNETGQRNFSSKLEVKEGMKPEITNTQYSYDYYHGDSQSHEINCEADGNPISDISWRRLSPEANTKRPVYKAVKDRLMFPVTLPEIAGQYECTAFNFLHNLNASKIFTITTRDKPFDWKILIWITTSGVVVLFSVIFIRVYYKRRERNLTNIVRHLTLKEIEDFFKGAALGTKPFFRQQVNAVENAVRMPYNDIFEIDPDDIIYDTSNLIGQGAFGMVFKATMRVGMKTVAVKTVYENVSTQVFKATLSELKILMYVGYHPHIVEFLGAITTDIESLDVKLVLEYCENGDMNKHLRNMPRNGLILDNQSGSLDVITKQFLKWLVGIAFGMEHLAKRKIIHGDLATRNILLNSNLDPKITDFGLSSKSADYSAYVKKGTNEPLPWRWMALESLTRFSFSSASDVWSFGVTAWEIFSFGSTPYPNCTWNESFVQTLRDGIRLPKPENCADKIFEEILSCWTKDLKLRADISSLKIKFQEILNSKL